ncbi:MAG: YHYH protein [Acidimicrobiia bacterium]
MRGPWFINNNTEYDLNQKVSVEGTVHWDGSFSMTKNGNDRVITTNDLPRDHTTGAFPVQPSDPAYQYNRNPNHIAAQSLTYALSANPTVRTSPDCVGGEVGVMTTGVALFDAFDAGGRDAGAWEVQDGCDGHPQMSGEYHYHTLSRCISDTSVSTVIGFALDGFPITGPKVAKNNILTTKDLDECHGITSTVTLDSKPVTTYHYVMTQDFPYSASCFRATATQPPGRP